MNGILDESQLSYLEPGEAEERFSDMSKERWNSMEMFHREVLGYIEEEDPNTLKVEDVFEYSEGYSDVDKKSYEWRSLATCFEELSEIGIIEGRGINSSVYDVWRQPDPGPVREDLDYILDELEKPNFEETGFRERFRMAGLI